RRCRCPGGARAGRPEPLPRKYRKGSLRLRLMLLAAAVLLTVGAIAFTLVVRDRDLPEPETKTGYEHLEERRARIYEGLRDLQFEYRVGKLSDADYQRTKNTLQTELAGVMAQIDAAKGTAAPAMAKAA